VARDRKRSQARRKRASSSGGNPASSRARDLGLDDPSIDEAGLGDTTPAPDPLKNASADVDQARAAEAGMVEDDDYEPAPDELEGDLVPDRGPVDPALREEAARRRSQRGRVVGFLADCWTELQRVQWPDRRHVGQATAVVLGFVVIAGSYLGLMDAIWKPIVNAII
jgi:preprotein translocase SecE subunit